MEFETVIGLEVHVQLATNSKIFSASSAQFGAEPNAFVDPVVLGLPGALPVANGEVVDCAIMLGMALGCEIRRKNVFARKHYFYPDLPKGYQISQADEPICERGALKIYVGDIVRTIGITRIHMEEDAGKSTHDPGVGKSYIDLNRAGTPLLEVVSQPDLRSPAEAAAYLKTIRQLVRYLGISDGNMEEGSLRCDANISLRPLGELSFGTRTEIKNINSFKFVEKALEYETARQLKIIKSGKEVQRQTLSYDSDANVTKPMRGKEESADYRYMPDPDLPAIVIDDAWMERIRQEMPELPAALREKFIDVYGLTEYDADVLTAEKEYAELFEGAVSVAKNAKAVCSWITVELFGLLRREQKTFDQVTFSPSQLGTLIHLIDTDVISGKMAKGVFEELFQTGKDPEKIIEEKGLRQITDPESVREVVRGVLSQNSSQVQEFHDGNDKVLGFFVGQVMKETQGSANPKVVNEVLREELKKLAE